MTKTNHAVCCRKHSCDINETVTPDQVIAVETLNPCHSLCFRYSSQCDAVMQFDFVLYEIVEMN